MRKLVTGYLKVTDIINKASVVLLFISLAIMTAVIFWQVIARFFLGGAFAWGEELSRFLMIFMVIIGAAVAVRSNSLIAVDVFLERATGITRRVMITLIHMSIIVFSVIIIYHGTLLAQNFAIQKAPSIQISMEVIYMLLPLGSVLMIMNSLACIIEEFSPRKEVS